MKFSLDKVKLWQYRRLRVIATHIQTRANELTNLTDAELRARTVSFRARLTAGASLADLLPETYATVYESVRRTLGITMFPVQVMGAVMLNDGQIIEMKNGEGKTVMATMPLYLRALANQHPRLITGNNYLAQRDALWMGPVFTQLGLSVGLLNSDTGAFLVGSQVLAEHTLSIRSILNPVTKLIAYQADVLYAPIKEIVSDYLADYFVNSIDELNQQGHEFAIVDEADTIMIDMARDIQAIGQPSGLIENQYTKFANIAHLFSLKQVVINGGSISLIDSAVEIVQKLLKITDLYVTEHSDLQYHLDKALRAKFLYQRDRDYIIKDKQIVLLDQLTGRPLRNQYLDRDLHQAIEAKEGLATRQNSSIINEIAIPNYLRLYKHLSGMTGTAATDTEEFKRVYRLKTIELPTNRPIIRNDQDDLIYRNKPIKMHAVVREIRQLYEKAQPVLVGCDSDNDAEFLSSLLRREGIPHELLTARYEAQEAEIISRAGEKSSVTVTTRMAGRGTDIVLGTGVRSLGGLHIIGTDRHEARRHDNQLRGRAGRQGDPGSSRFYLSLEDDLMRRFGPMERIKKIMEHLGVEDDEPIQAKLINRSIESAQQRVEGYNRDLRYAMLEFDDVLHRQRLLYYQERFAICQFREARQLVIKILQRRLSHVIHLYHEQHDINILVQNLNAAFIGLDFASIASQVPSFTSIIDGFNTYIENIVQEFEVLSHYVSDIWRRIILSSMTNVWVSCIEAITELKQESNVVVQQHRERVVFFERRSIEIFNQYNVHLDEEIAQTIFVMLA